jgi:hypothetical protein
LSFRQIVDVPFGTRMAALESGSSPETTAHGAAASSTVIRMKNAQ